MGRRQGKPYSAIFGGGGWAERFLVEADRGLSRILTSYPGYGDAETYDGDVWR